MRSFVQSTGRVLLTVIVGVTALYMIMLTMQSEVLRLGASPLHALFSSRRGGSLFLSERYNDAMTGRLSPTAAALLNPDSGAHVPVFVICRDRLRMLNRTVHALWDRVASMTKIRVILFDTGTTYGPTLELQQQMLAEGLVSQIVLLSDVEKQAASSSAGTRRRLMAKVRLSRGEDEENENHHHAHSHEGKQSRQGGDSSSGAGAASGQDGKSPLEILRDRVLNSLSDVVDEYMRTHPRVDYYVVTDPDVELDTSVPNHVFVAWAHILDVTDPRKVIVVGPSLRIDDLPSSNPRTRQVRHHEDMWFPDDPLMVRVKVEKADEPSDTNDEHRMRQETLRVYFGKAGIDTTMGMYRRGFKWHRLNHGIRTLAPYAAKHMPWYYSQDELSPDELYYQEHSVSVGHWTHGKHVDSDAGAADTSSRQPSSNEDDDSTDDDDDDDDDQEDEEDDEEEEEEDGDDGSDSGREEDEDEESTETTTKSS